MESLSQQLKNLNLSDNFYTGQDLSNEETSLEDLKKLIDERLFEAHQCSFYFGKESWFFLLSYQFHPKFCEIRLKKLLLKKKIFIRLAGVQVIRMAKDTIELI